MFLSKIRIKNYKSFNDSGEIEFKPGLNIIIGQNNSGKTALLEAIELKTQNKPHKNLNYDNSDISELSLKIFVKLDELNTYKLHNIYMRRPAESLSDTDVASKLNKVLENDIEIEIKKSSNADIRYENPLFVESHSGSTPVLFLEKNQGKYVVNSYTNISDSELIWNKIIRKYTDKVYRFNAERLNLGQSKSGESRELKSDASNLAEVLLNTKAHNDVLYERLINYICDIIPSVKWVTSVPIQNGSDNEIKIWNVNKDTERDDLAIPLSECGTGVGQVLAILYVVVTSREPRTIIIDEPNSFLHPGAAKKLIQILNKFPEHQYFISTHAPEVLSAAKSSTITRLKYIEGETIAESIDLEKTNELKETLLDIGVKFSDVFFAENILWVEGPTEAGAFPLILEAEEELFDVTFLPLVNVGDLREKKQARKNAKLAFEIYKRLSGEHALAPPFVAVIFDKEEENEPEIKELEKISKGKAKFIPRRMYENYLLDVEAIEEILNDEIIDGEKVESSIIDEWVTEKFEKREFLETKYNKKKSLKKEEWIKVVDSAKLLDKLFSELSKQTVEYRKTTHSIKLTQWLLENKPGKLNELKNFLIEIIENE